MSKKSTLGFQKILAWLMTEVMFARAHFTITRGLSHAASTVLNCAPRFFDMTLGAHADATQLNIARIFDRTSAASIHTLLSSALKEAATFKHGTATEVRKAVDEAKNAVASLEPIVAAIRTRRNQTLAHADARPFVDPNKYIKAGRVSYRDLEKLLDQTGIILNKFSQLYRGSSVVLELQGANDYQQALDLITGASQ